MAIARSNRGFAPVTEEEETDKRRYSELDKQPLCDWCHCVIKDTRVLLSRNLEWVGVYCSHKCCVSAGDINDTKEKTI